jgi:TRAP-type C4-dicarboxylate transport system substrate-binding protein
MEHLRDDDAESGEDLTMTETTRRTVLGGLAATGAAIAAPRIARGAAPRTLKISHQFPGGTIDQGDFRDRLCRKFAAEVEKRTNGELKFDLYPNSSLMKTNAQFSALRKGALDLSLVPVSYSGGEVPALNLGLMPCLVTSYEQGAAWKKAPIGVEFAKILDDKGVKILTWIWQAGGLASRATPVVAPEDAKGLKIRGGSREMDMVLKAAGAAVLTMPSNEIYVGMQTGAVDAALTSSTSLISFKLEELAKHLTTGRGKSYWFMLEPLVISKEIWTSLTPAQQKAVDEVGAELEPFGTDGAKADDQEVARVYEKVGAKVHDMDAAVVEKWTAIARETAWKDFADKGEEYARLLKLASSVPA